MFAVYGSSHVVITASPAHTVYLFNAYCDIFLTVCCTVIVDTVFPLVSLSTHPPLNVELVTFLGTLDLLEAVH